MGATLEIQWESADGSRRAAIFTNNKKKKKIMTELRENLGNMYG